MTHLDDDSLALFAMAELEPADAERAHLNECPQCALELATLRHTAELGRASRSIELVEPADLVWGRIHAHLGLSPAVAGVPRIETEAADAATESNPAHSNSAHAAPLPAASHLAPIRRRALRSASAHDAIDAHGPSVEDSMPVATQQPVASSDAARSGTVTPITRPRRARPSRRWWPMAAAAAVIGILGGVVGGVWWQSGRDQPTGSLVASADLEPFPGWQATGAARVEQLPDGRREVVVDVEGDDDSDGGLREVWLIRADATGLVSIGLLDGSSGRFVIPDGLDLAQYPLVDVSAEPVNGDPTHSGDSIVRGELRST